MSSSSVWSLAEALNKIYDIHVVRKGEQRRQANPEGQTSGWITLQTRREFVTSLMGSTLVSAGLSCTRSDPRQSSASDETQEKHPMKLSLSVRIAESPTKKDGTTMPLDEIIALANAQGYEAICMRASQVGIESQKDLIDEAAQKIAAGGLTVSMVTGDFSVPRNNDRGPRGLRDITPYLDLADQLGADLIRVCMKREEDIGWAQRAADEARERNIRLAHQAHTRSLFETVDGSVRVLRKIDRSNFGIIYEPANWLLSGQKYGSAAIRRVEQWMFNVYVQNCRIRPGGPGRIDTWTQGNVEFDHIGLWEDGGVDFDDVTAGLQRVNYKGYVTVHQAFAGIMSPTDAVRKSAEYLRPRIAPRTG